jgi:hypothetical protein
MGAAILVTVGVLFLLQANWYIYFDTTWPVLLIVIGLCSYAAHNASTEGHIQPWWAGGADTSQRFSQSGMQPQSEPQQSETDPQVKL